MRTDDEVRRDVLADSGLTTDEIDRWLTENPKPKLYIEQRALLRERWLDALYALCASLGIIRLSRRLGMRPRPWVTVREQ